MEYFSSNNEQCAKSIFLNKKEWKEKNENIKKKRMIYAVSSCFDFPCIDMKNVIIFNPSDIVEKNQDWPYSVTTFEDWATSWENLF